MAHSLFLNITSLPRVSMRSPPTNSFTMNSPLVTLPVYSACMRDTLRFSHIDGSPVLNLASFVHTWMPAQADKLMQENMTKNLIDTDEYPATRLFRLSFFNVSKVEDLLQNISILVVSPSSPTCGTHLPQSRPLARPLLAPPRQFNWEVLP